jgi:hypothetical protein
VFIISLKYLIASQNPLRNPLSWTVNNTLSSVHRLIPSYGPSWFRLEFLTASSSVSTRLTISRVCAARTRPIRPCSPHLQCSDNWLCYWIHRLASSRTGRDGVLAWIFLARAACEDLELSIPALDPSLMPCLHESFSLGQLVGASLPYIDDIALQRSSVKVILDDVLDWLCVKLRAVNYSKWM